MSNIKTLYTFTINKEVETEKVEEVDGGKLVKKVIELKPVRFALRRPNRSIIDANELFYGVKYNEAVKAGLMPRALFAKRLENDNGVFSDAQLKEQENLYKRLLELTNDITLYSTKPESEHTEEEKQAVTKTLAEYTNIQKRLTEYENAQQSMFDNTAESHARSKSLLWYSLFLSYQENDKGEFVPLYPGETFDAKLKYYDNLDEEPNSLFSKAAQKFGYFVTALFLGKAATEEEFKNLDEKLEGTFNSEKAEDAEPTKEEK